jgi:hypothetical protein
MKVFQKGRLTLAKALFAAVAVGFFAQCSNEEEKIVPSNIEVAAAADEAASVSESNVSSITVSGVYTEVVSTVDCSTCTFTVATGKEVIDGKELGAKPGAVICLDAAKKYGHLSFENMEGTAQSPITIGVCAH